MYVEYVEVVVIVEVVFDYFDGKDVDWGGQEIDCYCVCWIDKVIGWGDGDKICDCV